MNVLRFLLCYERSMYVSHIRIIGMLQYGYVTKEPKSEANKPFVPAFVRLHLYLYSVFAFVYVPLDWYGYGIQQKAV